MIKSKATSAAAALLCSFALVGSLAACSGDDKDKDAKTETSASAGAATSAPTAAGKSSVTVDGAAWEGNYSSKCTKVGDTTALSIYEAGGDARKGGGATLNGADTVVSVGLGESNSGLGYSLGAPGVEAATVAKSGNTFTVKGEAFGADLANPTQPKKSTFEIVFACDEVTGG